MTTHLRIQQVAKTTPTLITPPGVHSGVDITIQNNHLTYSIFIGAEDVTSFYYGHRLDPGKSVAFTVAPQDSLYIISDGEFGDVSILTLGLTKR